MRAVKFCENNLRRTGSEQAKETLQKEYSELVNVYETGCFRRCLRCRVKPFCQIQLQTIEAENAEALVEKVIRYVNEKSCRLSIDEVN
ncbi:hypothetical protein HMPREF9372_0166 [Sporosarcina newyorkensis 2681]|uniref:Uncharacterized protein n=1 Tax=Sporosarcina newyorkensis 2681 TaxID=1027292 RepID=F9DMY6_9BACL|nr:hypothetical protein HMPREF9372_0166 [Sporosarcina newyorkensis 2681]